jgi:DNA-binding GntR family transcriptional regulator
MNDPRAYVRLASLLRGMIESGELEPGKPVPSITTLTQEHGIARQTAAKALRMLESEGLVVRYPGLGYFVTEPS